MINEYGVEYAWFAEAECKDGTNICVRFEINENQNEDEQQYEIESWLLEKALKYGGATWYSVGMFEL